MSAPSVVRGITGFKTQVAVKYFRFLVEIVGKECTGADDSVVKACLPIVI